LAKSAIFVISLFCAGNAGCKCGAPPESDTEAAPSSSVSAGPSAHPTQEDTEIQPVYPADAGAPEALAVRFCTAVFDLPVQRRAACCKTSPGFSAASQCIRTLSYALRSGAVELAAADVERCAAAVTESTKGCDWVGPSSPPAPALCDGLIHGKVAAQKLCRSSLECAPDLYCRGLTATRAGICSEPRPEGSPCGGAIDTLGVYTLQLGAETAHPECARGYCTSGRCVTFTSAGGACSSNAQCGRGSSCREGLCSASPLPATGQPCASQECAEGNRCVRGICVMPRNYDESCESDRECRGACLVPEGATSGRCGMRCDTFSIPKTAPSAKGASGPKRR